MLAPAIVQTFVHILDISITAIQFHIIHIPVSKSLSINLHMIDDTGVAGTCVCSIIFINAEFQTLPMYLRIKVKVKYESSNIAVKID